MFSPDQSRQIAEKRLALTRSFASAIQTYIDRINRKGARLEMEVCAFDPGTGTNPVHFYRKSSPEFTIEAHLQGDLLKIFGTYWGGRYDFERLIPKITQDLITMEANKKFEAEMLATYGHRR